MNNFYQKKAIESYKHWDYLYDFLLPSVKQEKKESSQVKQSSRVIVSQEVADKLKEALEMHDAGRISRYEMIKACAKNYWVEDFSILNKLTPDTMIEILFSGYEAEPQTPEQKLERAIKRSHDAFAAAYKDTDHDELSAYRAGMRDTLAALGYDFNWLRIAKDLD